MNAQVRHRTRPRQAPSRRSVTWPLLAAVVVGAVTAAAVTAVRSAEPPCALPATAVTTDAATAPALRTALVAATTAGRLPGCAEVRVAVRDAVDVLAAGGPDPGLWLPDSSLWTARVERAVTVLGSVASSPVVVAGRAGAPGPLALADVLTAADPTGLVAPERDTAGLLTMLAAAGATAGPELAPTPQLAGAVVALDRRPLGSATAGFARLDADGTPFLTTALAAVQYSAAGRRTGTAPVAGVPPADYPLVAVGDVPAAAPVLDALRAPEAQDALRRAGLGAPQDVERPDPDRVRRVLALWTTLRVDSTLLAVIDVSGSMGADVGGRRRIDLAADAAQQGLALFPPGYEVGLWTFSARPDPQPDHDVVVPVGPLDGALPDGTPRADALASGADVLRGAETGGGTALHRTILEAVRAVRADFRPGREHTVVLLTDGRDEDDAGIGLDELLTTLRAEADPARPVPVIPVGVGPDVDLAGLQAVAEATGGRAYQALDPAQMREVFLDALLLRVCRPDC